VKVLAEAKLVRTIVASLHWPTPRPPREAAS
jgi:hypothetical protein